MEKQYWIGRKRAALEMARAATDAEARLIHYDLAGRYSVRAALGRPLMLVAPGPATERERAALQPHPPAAPEPGRMPGGPSVRGH